MQFNIEIKDIIDILSVALLLYYAYKFMKESGSVKVFTGVLIFVLLWLLVAQILEMRLLGAIFDQLVKVGAIALIILFQDDVRRFLQALGSHEKANRLFRLLTGNSKKQKIDRSEIMPIVMACLSMSKQKVGALMVFERTIPLNDIILTGDEINANMNQRLIENIFFKNSPLHDGAMIIREGRIAAAGCVLPLTQSTNLSKELGMRHRAGIGLSEQSDALVVIVSEESGAISVAMDGMLKRHLTEPMLDKLLHNELIQEDNEQDRKNIKNLLKKLF